MITASEADFDLDRLGIDKRALLPFMAVLSLYANSFIPNRLKLRMNHYLTARLTFRAPTTTEEQQFAFAQLRRHVENEEPSVWRTALSNGWIKLAEADLNDDGVPEIS